MSGRRGLTASAALALFCILGGVPCANSVHRVGFQAPPQTGDMMAGGLTAGSAASSIISSVRELCDHALGHRASQSRAEGFRVLDNVELAMLASRLLNESDSLQAEILDYTTTERALVELERGNPNRQSSMHRGDGLLLGREELTRVLVDEVVGERRTCSSGGLYDAYPTSRMGRHGSNGGGEEDDDEGEMVKKRPVMVRHRSPRDDVIAVMSLSLCTL